MDYENTRSQHDEQIPDDVDEAVEYLEEKVKSDIEILDSGTPNPLAPVGKQIAHALKVRRVNAEAGFVEDLKGQAKEKE